MSSLKTYGRCHCRCECLNTAVVKIRQYSAPPGIRARLTAILTPWTHICLTCTPHVADQVAETGRIWRP